MSRPRLHIGSGEQRLEGWVNVDLRPFPGVDVVADVTQGLEFSNVAAVYAEHFLEHLRLDDAFKFLAEVHRVLGRGGWLRLSTPNLDWVWQSHYRLDAPAEEKRRLAVMLNRAFHGWEHRFLWNREMLETALLTTGFAELRWCRYGESEREVFRGIEHHDTYGDTPELPHVLIVEAKKGSPRPEQERQALRDWLEGEFLSHVAGY